jgi:putative Mg2+ transporter-C (MgtC) family protein
MENLASFSLISWDTLLRLTLAFVLGGAIGMEREVHGRPAGLRTHILVCVGATIIMIASKYQSELYDPISQNIRITIDPGRIIAGIMTGIGFLGAGAIIRIGDIVRGLTTAACIWFVAALGIVIGEGFYVLATISTISILFLLIILQLLEYQLHPVVYRSVKVVAPIEKSDNIEKSCQSILEKENIRIQDRSYLITHETGRFEITFHVRTKGLIKSGNIIRNILKIPGIIKASWQ